MSRSNENPQTRERAFGYSEALAEVIADLTASEARRLEAERAAPAGALAAPAGAARGARRGMRRTGTGVDANGEKPRGGR